MELPWINLYEFYKGVKYSSCEDHRKFRAWTGVHPLVAEKIFSLYQNECLPDRTRLLIVLHFLKDMPTEDSGADQFHLGSRNTYRRYLWQSMEYLDYRMNEIKLENRLLPYIPKVGIFAGVSLIVDGTDCAIDRPTKRQDRNYHSNGRHKENTYGRYNLKYTVACQIISGKICSVIGPHGGSVADITALRDGDDIAIITCWNPLEILLADKGYQGHHKCLTPFKGKNISPEEDAFNEVLASVRILVECVLKRIKQFGALGSRGRFHCDREKHKAVFNVAAQVTNICMEYEPVWQQPNWYLSELRCT